MENVYANTLRRLSRAFEEGLSANATINLETISRATGCLMTEITNLSFDEAYKKALGSACIEAVSLIDPACCTAKKSTVKEFHSNLENELTYLFR